MNWTDNQKTEAAKLWAGGLDGPAIAERLGVTSKELYGLTRRNKAVFKPRPRGRTKKAAFTHSTPETRAEPVKVKARFPEKAPGYPGIPRGRLKSCSCEFPLWGDHETFDLETSPFCGAPRSPAGSKPYCGFHVLAARGRGTPAERRSISDAAVLARRETMAA